MKGYVRVSHLVYLIIIAVIILSFFLVIAFGGLENASTMLGTASTVSSLILSVIAILMSLVDVAGQRQQIVDLKETSEQLALSNQSSHELIENLMTKIDEISFIKDKLFEQEQRNEEWKKEIKLLIENSEGKKPEEYQKELAELIKKNEDLKGTVNLISNDSRKRYNRQDKDLHILEFLKGRFGKGEVSKIEVAEEMASLYNMTIVNVLKVLKRLEEDGHLIIDNKLIRIL